MQDKTNIIETELTDLDELEKNRLKQLRSIVDNPIEADTADEFFQKVGLKGYFREKYFPETLNSPISPSSIPEVKPIEYPSLAKSASDIKPDIDPSGTRTMHRSTNMASQEARDWLANQQTRFGKLKNKLKSTIPAAKQLGKSAGKIGATTAAGGMVAGVPGALLGGLLSLGEEVAFGEELGPEGKSDDAIIEDPRMPLEVRKAAMMRAKNKYLKPQED